MGKPVEKEGTDMNMQEIKCVVSQISGHRNRSCYLDLCWVVAAAVRHQPKEPRMRVLLEEARDMMDEPRTMTSINRSVSRAGDDIWENGSRQELGKVFGHEVIEKPTPRELVLRIAEFLWVKEGRIIYSACPGVGGCGIMARRGRPAYHAVTAPVAGSLEALTPLLERLNRDQMPLDAFEARYLLGGVLVEKDR